MKKTEKTLWERQEKLNHILSRAVEEALLEQPVEYSREEFENALNFILGHSDCHTTKD